MEFLENVSSNYNSLKHGIQNYIDLEIADASEDLRMAKVHAELQHKIAGNSDELNTWTPIDRIAKARNEVAINRKKTINIQNSYVILLKDWNIVRKELDLVFELITESNDYLALEVEKVKDLQRGHMPESYNTDNPIETISINLRKILEKSDMAKRSLKTYRGMSSINKSKWESLIDNIVNN